MKQGRRFFGFRQEGFEFFPACLQFNHTALDLGGRDTCTDGIHQLVLFFINADQFLSLGREAGGHLQAKPVELFGIFLAELGKIGGFHKMVFKTVEDDLFQMVPSYGMLVITGALVAPVGTGEMGFAEHAEAAAAGPTFKQS
nr:hypothetical protein [Emcibacter nanhaiensis]